MTEPVKLSALVAVSFYDEIDIRFTNIFFFNFLPFSRNDATLCYVISNAEYFLFFFNKKNSSMWMCILIPFVTRKRKKKLFKMPQIHYLALFTPFNHTENRICATTANEQKNLTEYSRFLHVHCIYLEHVRICIHLYILSIAETFHCWLLILYDLCETWACELDTHCLKCFKYAALYIFLSFFCHMVNKQQWLNVKPYANVRISIFLFQFHCKM